MNMEIMPDNLETKNQEVKQETENNYDREVPENEVVNFQKEIEEKVEEKAEELGVSKEELIGVAGTYYRHTRTDIH